MNILQSGISNIILSAGADTSSISSIGEHLNADFVMGAAVASVVFLIIIICITRKDKIVNTTAPAVTNQ
jgi:hypothetical protein